MNKGITIYDIADLVYATIKDLMPTSIDLSASPIGKDKLEVTIDGKIYNFTLKEIMEQRMSIKGFINLIKGRIS